MSADEIQIPTETIFRTFFEQSAVGKTITAPDGRLLHVNAEFARILGRTIDEARRLNFSEVTHPADLAVSRECVRALIAGERDDWRMEKRYLRPDGSAVWTLVNTRMVRSPDGRPLFFATTVQDIDARKRAETLLAERERQLCSLNEELEAIVRRRTAELETRTRELLESESRLAQSQKMEGIGKLAGGVAHDFNNILSVIMTNAEFIAEALPAIDPRRKDAEEIHKAARRAADLTRQLLAFSRKQVLEPRVLDLNETVKGMHKMLKRVIGEDIDLVTIPGTGLWSVKADPGQMEQVLMNLAVNARDAMPKGGKLTIETKNIVLDDEHARAHEGVAPGPHAMLAMSDNGCGMDRETMSRIFEPFFTTKGVGKGTGLGLSTVHGIVKQSGGSIFVYIEPGKGTSFKIYLPRHGEGGAALPAPGELKAAPGGTETILLVEDEAAVRQVAREILRRKGYNVIETADTDEAEAICRAHDGTIDLLLTDVVMPKLGGRGLAERLGKLRPDMKVIYMSGYTDDAVVRHGVLDAGTVFIQKPFTPESLPRKVREVLDDRPKTGGR